MALGNALISVELLCSSLDRPAHVLSIAYDYHLKMVRSAQAPPAAQFAPSQSLLITSVIGNRILPLLILSFPQKRARY